MTLRKSGSIILVVLLVSFLLGACQAEEKGLPRWYFGVEGAELKVFSTFDTAKMKEVSMTVEREHADGNTVTEEMTGIPMKEILNFLEVTSYSSVTVISKTGSQQEYPADIMEDPTTLLVYEVNGKSVWDDSSETVQVIAGKLPEDRWLWNLKTLKINP